MNRNTILAFLLILATISFFSSKFYYENILKKPHPSSVRKKIAKNKRENQYRDDKGEEEKQEGKKEKVIDLKQDTIDKVTTKEKGIEEIIESNKGSIEKDEEETLEKFDTLWVETEKLIVGISERGARIISIKTKDYRKYPTEDKKSLEENPYIEIVNDEKSGGANLTINKENYDSAVFKCDKEEDERIELGEKEKKKLTFTYGSNSGEILKKCYIFHKNKYIIDIDIYSSSLEGKKVGLGWKGGIAESEDEPGKMARYNIRKIHLFGNDNVSHINKKKEGKSEESGYYKWVALTSKYFLVAIISDSASDADVEIEAYKEMEEEEGKRKKEEKIDYKFISKRFAQSNTESYSIYTGPSSLNDLKSLDVKLEKVMFGGWKWFLRADIWFPSLCEFVLWLLIFLQKGIKDYGLVIIVLTILSRVITYPLTRSSMKSMSRMRELQPKVNEIRQKYKSNAQKMNKKMMELYKKEGVNPLNPGCLPMFLQMPVFISLFVVLRKAIEIRGKGTWIVPWVNDLSKPEVFPIPGINPLPFNIPIYGNNIALLPIIMAILTYFQNKATIKDPNQKAMIYFMPIFMMVIFNSFPSGLVLYWTFSSVLQLFQQFLTNKKKLHVSEEKAR